MEGMILCNNNYSRESKHRSAAWQIPFIWWGQWGFWRKSPPPGCWLLPPAATASSKAGGQVRIGHPEPSNPMILIHAGTKWPGLSCWNSLLQLSSPIPRPPRQTSRNHQEDFCLSLPHHHHLATGTRLSLESIKTDGNHPSLPFNTSFI